MTEDPFEGTPFVQAEVVDLTIEECIEQLFDRPSNTRTRGEI